MAKKKPLKKDRKAGNRPANAGPKKPFYQEIGAKRPQKKKPHPFGKGWELAEDFDRLEEGEYAARCTALDEDGNGIVQIEGVSFAVGGLLPGRRGRSLSPAEKAARAACAGGQSCTERVKPRCPVFGRCGGCRLQHLSYDGQLELKQRTVEQLMQEYIAQGAKFYQILGMNEPWRYRNKAHATFSLDGRGRIISGIYEESSHRVVPVERCLIQDERAEQIAASIRQIMRECRIQPYDEDRGTGAAAPHPGAHRLCQRAGDGGAGDRLAHLPGAQPVCLAAAGEAPGDHHHRDELQPQADQHGAGNPGAGAVRQGLHRGQLVRPALCHLAAVVLPGQPRPDRSPVSAGHPDGAADRAGAGAGRLLRHRDHLADRRRQAKEVIGVELNRDAVQDAIANAKRNGVRNATFICEDAGRFMTRMAQEREGVDVVFLDRRVPAATRRFCGRCARWDQSGWFTSPAIRRRRSATLPCWPPEGIGSRPSSRWTCSRRQGTANASHHYQNKKKGALALFFDALFSSFANLSLKKRKHAAGAALVLAPGITLDAEKDRIRGRRGPCPHFREDGEELYPPLDIFSKSPLTF